MPCAPALAEQALLQNTVPAPRLRPTALLPAHTQIIMARHELGRRRATAYSADAGIVTVVVDRRKRRAVLGR